MTMKIELMGIEPIGDMQPGFTSSGWQVTHKVSDKDISITFPCVVDVEGSKKFIGPQEASFEALEKAKDFFQKASDAIYIDQL